MEAPPFAADLVVALEAVFGVSLFLAADLVLPFVLFLAAPFAADLAAPPAAVFVAALEAAFTAPPFLAAPFAADLVVAFAAVLVAAFPAAPSVLFFAAGSFFAAVAFVPVLFFAAVPFFAAVAFFTVAAVVPAFAMLIVGDDGSAISFDFALLLAVVGFFIPSAEDAAPLDDVVPFAAEAGLAAVFLAPAVFPASFGAAVFLSAVALGAAGLAAAVFLPPLAEAPVVPLARFIALEEEAVFLPDPVFGFAVLFSEALFGFAVAFGAAGLAAFFAAVPAFGVLAAAAFVRGPVAPFPAAAGLVPVAVDFFTALGSAAFEVFDDVAMLLSRIVKRNRYILQLSRPGQSKSCRHPMRTTRGVMPLGVE